MVESTEGGDKLPRDVEFLPDERVDLSYLRHLRDASRFREIWIRRYLSRDEIGESNRDVLDLHLGFVPSVDIEGFVARWQEKIMRMDSRRATGN